MAFMGSGGSSSFDGGFGNGMNHDKNKGSARYYRGMLFRRYYYIPLDNTYFLFQMIAAITVFLIAGIIFITTYKPTIIDPLENTKKIIMNTYLAIILALISAIILISYISKNKNSLKKRLITLFIISVTLIITFLGIKVNLDSIYTKNKFEQIYIQENADKTTDDKTRLGVGLSGVQMKSEKDYYVDECVKAYNVFGMRIYGIVLLNVLIMCLLIFQILKVSKIQEKRDKLNKDDAILFDEEENIKF